MGMSPPMRESVAVPPVPEGDAVPCLPAVTAAPNRLREWGGGGGSPAIAYGGQAPHQGGEGGGRGRRRVLQACPGPEPGLIVAAVGVEVGQGPRCPVLEVPRQHLRGGAAAEPHRNPASLLHHVGQGGEGPAVGPGPPVPVVRRAGRLQRRPKSLPQAAQRIERRPVGAVAGVAVAGMVLHTRGRAQAGGAACRRCLDRGPANVGGSGLPPAPATSAFAGGSFASARRRREEGPLDRGVDSLLRLLLPRLPWVGGDRPGLHLHVAGKALWSCSARKLCQKKLDQRWDTRIPLVRSGHDWSAGQAAREFALLWEPIPMGAAVPSHSVRDGDVYE